MHIRRKSVRFCYGGADPEVVCRLGNAFAYCVWLHHFLLSFYVQDTALGRNTSGRQKLKRD